LEVAQEKTKQLKRKGGGKAADAGPAGEIRGRGGRTSGSNSELVTI